MTEPTEGVAFAVDEDGILVHVGSGCHALLGWSSQQLTGTPLTRIIPERFREEHREGFRRFLEAGAMPLEHRSVRLHANHAHAGEVAVDLTLRRAGDGDPDSAIAFGVLTPGIDPAAAELSAPVHHAMREEGPQATLLRESVAAAARRQGWSVASVWWMDPWVGRLRPISIWEEQPGDQPHFIKETLQTVLARGEGLVGQVWAEGVPSFHEDLNGDLRALRSASITADGFHAGLHFPLKADGEMVGVVEMLSRERRTFDSEDREAVWSMADELARLVSERLRGEHESVQRQRLQMALSAGMMGVWSFHFETGIVSWDEHLEALVGMPPGSFGGDVDDLVDRIHPDDRAATLVGLRRSVEQGKRFDHQFRAVRADGETIWLQAAASSVTDSAGNRQALTGVIFDVTERIESQRRLDEQTRHATLAADVGRALVSRDPLEDRLQETVEAVVKHTNAAFARIWTVGRGDDTLRLAASAGLYTHLDGDHSSILLGEMKIGTIAATGRPHLTNDVANDPMISDPAWAFEEGMVAFAGYPLIVGDEVVGVLGLFAQELLPESTIAALASIADSIAIAILQSWDAAETEAAMRDRAYVAEVLQSSLLPPSLPKVPGLEIEAAYRAGVEEVGGDFYDILPLATGWAFVIGDVCGRGPEAARLTALTRHSLRTAMLLGNGPVDALAALNDSMLAAKTDRRFCTVVCGTIAVDRADASGPISFITRLAVGGHPLPLVRRAAGIVEEVGVPGPLLGIVQNPVHTEVTVELGPGDMLVLFTDGVIEARSGTELFGSERLTELVRSFDGGTAAQVVESIVESTSAFASSAVDDLAVLALRVIS